MDDDALALPEVSALPVMPHTWMAQAAAAHHAAWKAAHYAAVRSNLLYMGTPATLIANRRIGRLPPELIAALAVVNVAEYLDMSPEREAHIHENHKHDAVAVVSALPSVLNIDLVRYVTGRVRAQPDERTIVVSHARRRWLLVALKFVPARRSPMGCDEAWVTTGYFVDDKELRRQLHVGHIVPYQEK